MKIKTIISSICLMLLAVSCSMGDEVLDEKGLFEADEDKLTAEFNISIGIPGDLTKSTKSVEVAGSESPEDSENDVYDCFIAIVDEASGAILGSHFFEGYNESVNKAYLEPEYEGGSISFYKTSQHITVKVAKDINLPVLRFVAFAQLAIDYVDKENLRKQTNLGGLKKVLLTTQPNVMVKCGSITTTELIEKGELPETGYKAISTNLTHTDESCNNIQIPVYQRSARIQLDSFQVVELRAEGEVAIGAAGAYTETEAPVQVTGLQLLNVTMNTYMEDESVQELVDADYTYRPGKDKGYPYPAGEKFGNFNEARFYTYQNTAGEKPVKLKIYYTVLGVPSDCTVEIKTPGYEKGAVLANHIYKLYVKITNGTAEGTCTVNDFTPNTVTGNWEEVK